MLTPAQLLPFLAHEHLSVRTYVRRYLLAAADPSPATAEDFWREIDRLGPGSEARSLMWDLLRMPQTDASVRRLVDALDRFPDQAEQDILARALRELDLPTLARHRQLVLAVPQFDDADRRELGERLGLAELPVEEIWRRLEALSVKLREGDYPDDDDGDVARDEDVITGDWLADALAFRAPEGPPRAADYLLAGEPEAWMASFCARAVSEARYRPGLDGMVKALAEVEADDDFMHEECARGIPRVGGPDAVAALEHLAKTGPDHVRIYVLGALGRIPHPSAEAALVRLLSAGEFDEEGRSQAAAALANLCPTGEAFDPLLRMARTGDYDRQFLDAKEECFVIATVSGATFPEFDEYRAHADEGAARQAAYLAGIYAAGNFGDEFDDEYEDDEYEDDDYDYADDYASAPVLPDQLTAYEPPVVRPIRNEAPKVGRNDPCPCGSGKKYKKCCGKNA